MKIGLVQFAPVWEDPMASVGRLTQLFDGHSAEVDLFVFPEMTLTGFTKESEKFAEGPDGVGIRFFMDLAKASGAHVLAGVIQRDGDHLYNALVHMNRSGILEACYSKIHPFSFAQEEKHFSAGRNIVATHVDRETVGLSVCYDLRFPELYRLYAKNGATILVNSANWPAARAEHWHHLMRARAIENQCFMIGVNRVGNDPRLAYGGGSAIYGPGGEVVVECDAQEVLAVVDLELDRVAAARAHMPVLDDIKLI